MTTSSRSGTRISTPTGRTAGAKPAAKKAAVRTGAAKTAQPAAAKAQPRGLGWTTASSRAELTAILARIHRNLDETEALLAD